MGFEKCEARTFEAVTMLESGSKEALRACDGIDSEILLWCAEDEVVALLTRPASSSEPESLKFNLCSEGG